MLRDVEQIADEPGQPGSLVRDALELPIQQLRIDGSPRMCRPVKGLHRERERGERRLELVGCDREEFVAGAEGLLRSAVEPGVVDGVRGAAPQLHRELEVGASVAAPGVLGREAEHAERLPARDERHRERSSARPSARTSRWCSSSWQIARTQLVGHLRREDRLAGAEGHDGGVGGIPAGRIAPLQLARAWAPLRDLGAPRRGAGSLDPPRCR